MFSKKGILDLNKFFSVLLQNKYKIIIFTFITVLSTNIYVQKFKDTIKIEKTFVVKNNINKLLGKKLIRERIIKFIKKNSNYNGGKFGYYNFKGKYILKAIFIGIDENEVESNINKFTKLFNDEVVNDFVDFLKKDKESKKSEFQLISKQITIYSDNIKKLDLLIMNMLENNISNESSELNNIYKLNILKKSQVKSFLKFKGNNKKTIGKFIIYKKFMDINNKNIFNIKETKYTYKVDKIKFFIFSTLFSFIMSITVVILFFNRNGNRY